MAAHTENPIERLAGRLVVSCQDYQDIMIKAALEGGADGLRLNGPGDVRRARQLTEIPIIGCNKLYFPNSPIYITPSIRSALVLVEAGCQIVALDCTRRRRARQQPVDIIKAIHDAGALALADLSCLEEAEPAIRDGADILATTLAPVFDAKFIRQLAVLGRPVLAEGHVDSPEQAKEALRSGAWAVCVGTAITRPHVIAKRFKMELENGR